MEWRTIKIRLNTYRVIKRICGITGEKLVDMLHRIIVEEWGRVKEREVIEEKPVAKKSK